MGDETDDSTPPRPRRKIRNIVVMSSSGSETEDSGPATSTRKKRLRVLSESDEGSSSSSVALGRRRKRAPPKLRDSEISDSSGWETDNTVSAPISAGSSQAVVTATKPTSGFASDSSEGNSDKCSICLMRFTDQQVGTPQTCEHIFCLDCISEWSKNVNTCPVDRMTFDSIVVRECAGGRVLSTQPVQVVERPPSVDLFLVQETSCEICGSSGSEATMLLCDGCDLGFHMECLTPPLTEIPINQWLCSSCSDRFDNFNVIPALEELFSEEEEVGGSLPWRRLMSRSRNLRQRQGGESSRPSNPDVPSTSRSRAPPAASRAPAPSSRARTRTRTRKRRRTRTVIIEYELEENGKCPVTKRVRRKIKRRKTKKRAPRTVARRSHVRESVRAKLAAQRAERAAASAELGTCGSSRALAARRALASVPALNLFGSSRDLDYFSDEEPEAAGGGGLALASRPMPASSARVAYRQAIRKMVSIPSPTPASAAPDILSSILESQTLLHSRQSIVSVTINGELDIKLHEKRDKPVTPAVNTHDRGIEDRDKRDDRVDVTRAGSGSARQVPSYGQSRGGGWGGGYRYPADRAPGPPPAGPSPRPQYDNGYGGGNVRPDRRHDEGFHSYERHRYDIEPFEHDRRRSFDERRPWPPHRPAHPHRHSFPFSGAVDMRTGPPPRAAHDKPYTPLPEPPSFPLAEEEDERSDSSLVIDTDKYDPTEPTDDDDSAAVPAPSPKEPTPPPPPLAPPASLAAVESILAGMDTPAVPSAILDSAVRQVLFEHRNLVEAPSAHHDSDEGSDGDCPNFSIYSATSVHIASGTLQPPPEPPILEDLIQGDGDEEATEETPPAPPSPPTPPGPPTPPPDDAAKRKSEEYNEKVSKRCPITTNTRNPIKIKLNTPSLIRRQVSLYDEEDTEEPEAEEPTDSVNEPSDETPAETPTEVPAVLKDAEKESEEENEKSPKSEDKEDDVDPSREPSEERDREGSDKEGTDKGRTPSIPEELAEETAESPLAKEKMTESISETEDERSYTPCLDEHKEEPDRGLEGLDTEMISEDEGNGLFSEEERRSPPAPQPAESPAPETRVEDTGKKKKKKESKREGKERKGKKRTDVAFKKAGKVKERNYRERDGSESRGSPDSERRRKREKRKDLERYDVRTLVSEKRRRTKDAFGRDISPRERSPSPPPRRGSGSPTPPRARSSSPRRIRQSPSPRRIRQSPSPRRLRQSPSPRRIRSSPSPRRIRSSPSPRRIRTSPSPRRIRPSLSPRRIRTSPSPTPPPVRRSVSPRAARRRRRSSSRGRRTERRRRSGSRRKRRRSASAPPTKPKEKKKKKRARSRSRSPARRKSPKRKRLRRRSASPGEEPPAWSPRPASPRTPPPQPAPPPVPIEARRLRKRRDRSKHRRADNTGPSKEVFTSGDNILVSVSFKDPEERDGVSRRERRRSRRRRRRAQAQEDVTATKPVAIIDLERSPFRELTPSPERVIVLSDDERPATDAPAETAVAAAGPKTPPEPNAAAPTAGPNTPPEPPDSPDAYDPYEPTASPPAPAEPPAAPEAAPEPARLSMTLEAAQKTNMSADEVIDRRPLEPIEKVMALLQSTRDAPPDPPPEVMSSGGAAGATPAPAAAPGMGGAPAPRVVLPEPAAKPKLFLGKPSPIKSDPIKPMQQATKISRLPLPAVRGDSPYSPGSSDFGDLFEPPSHHDSFDALFDKPPPATTARRKRNKKKKGKTQVDVKLDDDNLKVMDELPSSAVEMQVKSKVSNFLKKLNRQERVVEEVKLVLKPHYNKKHVTKEEYKHILRRAVPKICHNKTGEINPTKIQGLVEAYVKKFRKKHKLGLS